MPTTIKRKQVYRDEKLVQVEKRQQQKFLPVVFYLQETFSPLQIFDAGVQQHEFSL